jgi:hypothetical protein
LLLLAVVAVAIPLGVAVGQGSFAAAVFEFGVVRSFEGVVREHPYPTLEVTRPAVTGGAATSRFYLVARGKHGAGDGVAGLDGRRVRLEGSLIYRDDQTMIELVPGSVTPVDGAPGAAAEAGGDRSFGTRTLRGRIVDSKCFLGVMKPGSGKTHRACANLCIRGGIPPLFVVEDGAGPAAYLLLVGVDGGAVNREVLDVVDLPLEITGEVVRSGDLWILRADPATYRRWS